MIFLMLPTLLTFLSSLARPLLFAEAPNMAGGGFNWLGWEMRWPAGGMLALLLFIEAKLLKKLERESPCWSRREWSKSAKAVSLLMSTADGGGRVVEEVEATEQVDEVVRAESKLADFKSPPLAGEMAAAVKRGFCSRMRSLWLAADGGCWEALFCSPVIPMRASAALPFMEGTVCVT